MNWTRIADGEPKPYETVDVQLANEFMPDGSALERRLMYIAPITTNDGEKRGARWFKRSPTTQKEQWERTHPDDKWRPTFVTHQPSRDAELEEARS